MLHFPIQWKLNYTDLHNSRLNFNLSDEWSASYEWEQVRNNSSFSYYYKPYFIEIRRKTNFEEASITGTFSFLAYGRKASTYTFSKLIKGGSEVTKLIYLHTKEIGHALFPNSSCDLRGAINITYASEKCTDLETRGSKIYLQPKSLVQLSDDLARLLDPQTSCNPDVNLKCGSSSIPAHKLILSARSPVFAAMFKSPMKESHKNEVDITDIDESVLRAMVSYIYSGKTTDLTVSSASDLLFAADKYQLPDLKRVCCDFLKESISLENVIRFLNLGDLFAEDLKSLSVNYICENYTNFAEFEKLEEWGTLRKEKPALAVDVLSSLLKSKDQ